MCWRTSRPLPGLQRQLLVDVRRPRAGRLPGGGDQGEDADHAKIAAIDDRHDGGLPWAPSPPGVVSEGCSTFFPTLVELAPFEGRARTL